MSKLVRTEILGNDGIHEWGRNYYEGGLIVEWWENLKAREQFAAEMRVQRDSLRELKLDGE